MWGSSPAVISVLHGSDCPDSGLWMKRKMFFKYDVCTCLASKIGLRRQAQVTTQCAIVKVEILNFINVI